MYGTGFTQCCIFCADDSMKLVYISQHSHEGTCHSQDHLCPYLQKPREACRNSECLHNNPSLPGSTRAQMSVKSFQQHVLSVLKGKPFSKPSHPPLGRARGSATLEGSAQHDKTVWKLQPDPMQPGCPGQVLRDYSQAAAHRPAPCLKTWTSKHIGWGQTQTTGLKKAHPSGR